MHDVDLLPVNPQLKYVNPGDGFALHIASPKLHPKYHYETFVGGILILTTNDYKKLNGLSNKYWGWGLEDDEFYQRMKQGAIKLLRPENVMDYSELTERLRKTLYYGSVAKASASLNSSLPLTRVIVEKFTETDSNLFLEKLCFEYAAELSREACLSPCSLVVALIYLDRLCQSNPNFVSSIPSSKLFLISVMVASKFLNDDGEDDEVINSEWANSAKIELSDLNQIERQFLQAIEWRLFVDDQEFAEALARIEFRVAQRESLKRGWLTYTDLDILAQRKLLTDTWDVVYDLIINVSVACMTAYLASLVTLVGSAIVVSSLPWNNCSSLSSPPLATPPPAMSSSFTRVATSNASSALPQPEIDVIDPEVDFSRLTISEIAFQHPDLDSDAFLKDFTAIALGSFSHQPKPPFLMTNETTINVTVKNFTDPLVFLQQSYCALIGSIIGFQSNSYALSPLCLTVHA
uniref:Protein CNPPD1 n=1 Tax=Daphnia pulex TaxID=6669 RepID=A0A4Y7MV12_DAPPU|nr:EOG090X069C [Daphnia pulex]